MFDFNSKDAGYINGKFNRMKDIPNFRTTSGYLKKIKYATGILFVANLITEVVRVVLDLKSGDKNEKPRK